MRNMFKVLPLALAGSLLLGACSSGPKETPTSDNLQEVQSVSVEGDFGVSPTMTFSGDPSEDLQRTFLDAGDEESPAVSDDTLVVVEYYGQIFNGAVFDQSFDKDEPFVFTQVDSTDASVPQEVIDGWEIGLDGAHEGSRVLLSVPSELAYGETGSADAGIGSDDTLVFVVDVLKVYDKDANAQADAKVISEPFPGVSIEGELGEQAKLSIDPESEYPTEATVIVLAEGSGPPAEPGVLAVQFTASDWAGAQVSSTWDVGGISALPVGNSGTEMDTLVGLPIGSRVLMVFAPYPEDTEEMKPSSSAAVLVDIVGQAYVS